MNTVVAVPTITRYRRVPRPFRGSDGIGPSYGQAAREKQCERSTGHCLIVSDKGITCAACGAEWHDYRH